MVGCPAGLGGVAWGVHMAAVTLNALRSSLLLQIFFVSGCCAFLFFLSLSFIIIGFDCRLQWQQIQIHLVCSELVGRLII